MLDSIREGGAAKTHHRYVSVVITQHLPMLFTACAFIHDLFIIIKAALMGDEIQLGSSGVWLLQLLYYLKEFFCIFGIIFIALIEQHMDDYRKRRQSEQICFYFYVYTDIVLCGWWLISDI